MSALDKKLLRDLARLRGQVVTIALVVACGIASYVAVVGTHASLEKVRDAYYEQQRFADVFADLTRAPTTLAARIAELPGVMQVQTGVRENVRLPLPGMLEPARGQVIAVDARKPAVLDRLGLLAGRLPRPGHEQEAVVLESFATAHAIKLGDALPIVLGGTKRSPRVVGIALSPDFVFPIAQGEIVFDTARYGVVWMDASVVERAVRMAGAFNHVSLRLQPGASDVAVRAALDRLLASYGGLPSYAREKHPSHALLEGEMSQLAATARIVPSIFLFVAAFLVNVVLSRLVQIERPEIAALKAMGYGGRALGLHYVKLVSVIVLLGAAIGTAGGAYTGNLLTNLYTDYFRFPDLRFLLDAKLTVQAAFVSLASAFAGALVTARGVMRLPPAEAMRPPQPLDYRRGLLEQLALSRLLSPSARMVLRELSRRPLRAFLSSLGIAMAVAVLVLGRFSNDAIARLIDVQFRTAQREDVEVAFVRALPERAARELAHLPGVIKAEGVRVQAVRISAGPRERHVALVTELEGAELRRIVDADGRPVGAPAQGVALTRKLAEVLGVVPGDSVWLERLEGARQLREVRVAGTVDDLFGLNVYVSRQTQRRLFAEQPMVSSAVLRIEDGAFDALLARLIDLPSVLGVSRREANITRFEAQNARQMLVMTLILTVFAAIIAAGVVYNNARVSLSMRGRELASLRVLGFRRREISMILLGELAVQTLFALAPGMWLGKQIVLQMIANVDPELYRFPVVISTRTYGFACAVTLVAAIASAMFVRRRLDRLDLIAVLKTRE